MTAINKFIWLKIYLTVEQMLTWEHVGQKKNCHLFTDTAHTDTAHLKANIINHYSNPVQYVHASGQKRP